MKNDQKQIQIADLEFPVGPAGSSEAVGALPCGILIGVIIAKNVNNTN